MKMKLRRTCIAFAGILFLLSSHLSGQDISEYWPTKESQWVNSNPIPAEKLSGKAVVFYFFEETCPRCRGRWPEFLKTMEAFENEPYLLIGVNSGTSKKEVEAYAKNVGLKIPFIVDHDRSLEKTANVGSISLQNIYQVAFINGRGELKRGNWSNMQSTMESALKDAEWQNDPGETPDELRRVHRAIEFGLYSEAARGIRRVQKSADPELKSASQRLTNIVTEQMQAKSEVAFQLGKEEKFLESFFVLEEIRKTYDGFPLPEKVEGAYQWLIKKDEVKAELSASKLLERATEALQKAGSSHAKKLRAKTMFETLVNRYPDTRAGAEAKALLDSSAN